MKCERNSTEDILGNVSAMIRRDTKEETLSYITLDFIGWWDTRTNAGQLGMRREGSQRNWGDLLRMAKQEAEWL